MTKSSRTRKARKIRKVSKPDGALRASQAETGTKLTLTRKDKRYLLSFLVISLLITIAYWIAGGRNLFVFPAVFCIAVGASRYWRGPVRRFAEKSAD